MFRTPLAALAALSIGLAAAPANAASDIEFKTSGPVLIFVDGEQATLTSKLKQRVAGLNAGAHEVTVQGVFGKTLYEAEINLPDGTLTQAEWSGRELRVLSTDWLPEQSDEPDDDMVALEAEPPAEPPAEEPPVEEAVPADEPVALEMDDPPILDDDAPLAVPQPATALPTAAPGKTVTIQAQDGMRVEVVHEGRTVVVVVEDGRFAIEDPQGLQIALSSN